MSEQVNTQGQVINTNDIDGVVGYMPLLTTDTGNAKVDFSGYLYKEKEINGVSGRMPVVALDEMGAIPKSLDGVRGSYSASINSGWGDRYIENRVVNYYKLGSLVYLNAEFSVFQDIPNSLNLEFCFSLPFPIDTGSNGLWANYKGVLQGHVQLLGAKLPSDFFSSHGTYVRSIVTANASNESIAFISHEYVGNTDLMLNNLPMQLKEMAYSSHCCVNLLYITKEE